MYELTYFNSFLGLFPCSPILHIINLPLCLPSLFSFLAPFPFFFLLPSSSSIFLSPSFSISPRFSFLSPSSISPSSISPSSSSPSSSSPSSSSPSSSSPSSSSPSSSSPSSSSPSSSSPSSSPLPPPPPPPPSPSSSPSSSSFALPVACQLSFTEVFVSLVISLAIIKCATFLLVLSFSS